MAPQPLTVRYNRTAGAWLAVFGSTALLVLLVHDVLFDPRGPRPFAIPYLVATLLLAAGLTALLRTAYFTYDPAAERIEARAFWGARRAYPRTGYSWIAYSTDPLQIREVAPDGRSRPIPISHLTADPEDWAEFLGTLHDLSADEPDPRG